MLIGNYSAIGKSPGIFIGGTTVSGDRGNFSKSGANRNRWTGLFDEKSGVPSGHLPPSSWILPQFAGGMSSSQYATLTITAAANGAAGINIVGDTTITITADALGQLIASAIGAASFVISADGSIVATLGAPGSASFSITADATINALANMLGTTTVALTASLVSYATGSMVGAAYLAGESAALTPDGVAAAVWLAVAGDSNTVGSMGEKLNDAGSGSNPWTEVIESGYTAAEILRLLTAVAQGNATGLENGLPRFKSIDGTTDRIEATYVDGVRVITNRNAS